MLLKTDGVVIREKGTGESDRFVTLLTRDYGVLHAFARGAKSLKSEKQSGTQLFAYADFTVSRGKDAFIVTEARAREVFYKLRENVEHLALAQYFCELSGLLAPEETPAEEYLRLLLNALYLLTYFKEDRGLRRGDYPIILYLCKLLRPDKAVRNCESRFRGKEIPLRLKRFVSFRDLQTTIRYRFTV